MLLHGSAHVPCSGRVPELHLRLTAFAVLLVVCHVAGASGYAVAQAVGLPGALLTNADLPGGWTVEAPLSADAGLPDSCPAWPAAVQPVARVGVLLAGRAVTELAYETVTRYPSGEAAAVLAAASTEAAPCAWTQPLDDGSAAQLLLLPPTALPFGVEALLRRFEMRGDAMLVTGELVLIRCGDYTAQFEHLLVGRAVDPHDRAVTQVLAEAADRRLREAIGCSGDGRNERAQA
jgi:hypothetical protein